MAIDLITNFEAYQKSYAASVADPEQFWAEQAAQFTWHKRWDTVLSWDFDGPDVRWFEGGQLNITENCLDRHLTTKGDQPAIVWESNDPKAPHRILTYRMLYHEVCRTANAFRALGIAKGDRICLYMPMVPELAIAVLACARIGAVHSVVFAGFSATALADRIRDAGCKLVVCSDVNHRGPKKIPVKTVVDEALEMDCPSVAHVLMLKLSEDKVPFRDGRDIWWHDLVPVQPDTCTPASMHSEDMLFILYTSGSTGKPKGVVHTIAGYMVYAWYTFRQVFQWRAGDVYFCTADIGWVTGHTYIVYGPLLEGATVLMFEGVPTYPTPARFWEIIAKHRVSQFYTAPTAIRALMAMGDEWTEGHDFSSIRLLGSVGEPINEEAWQWYHQRIGRGSVPIVDTWWQTETGGIMISPIPNATPQIPAYAGTPLPGVQLCLMDEKGSEITTNPAEGILCIKYPWPGILRTTFGDHRRCRETYFSTYPGYYFSGDGARRDEQGLYRIIGRVDDVINVSGHRIGTAEVENAINLHPWVVESAVVGFPHPIKGQGIYAYLIITHEPKDRAAFEKEIMAVVTKHIGPIARPDRIHIGSGIPRTRSGKIMRRILRKIAAGSYDDFGDTSTLLNPEVIDELIEGVKKNA